jgi:hypothetical protein
MATATSEEKKKLLLKKEFHDFTGKMRYSLFYRFRDTTSMRWIKGIAYSCHLAIHHDRVAAGHLHTHPTFAAVEEPFVTTKTTNGVVYVREIGSEQEKGQPDSFFVFLLSALAGCILKGGVDRETGNLAGPFFSSSSIS